MGAAVRVNLDIRPKDHAQFYGPAAVDGQVEDPNYGQIVNAAAPRLVQLAAKFAC
jgi:hypothetical protein